MKMKILLIVTGILLALATAGCPKPECTDGSSRTSTSPVNGKAVHEHCYNGEWVKEN